MLQTASVEKKYGEVRQVILFFVTLLILLYNTSMDPIRNRCKKG